jgi:phosphoribosylformylglycinamidine synthase
LRTAIIQSPGSNCDQDAFHALNEHLGIRAEYVWYKETSLAGFDAVIIPGGFTFGDYLRGGAVAARAPVIEEVRRFAAEGRPVLGICNGFQILTECGILPGALVTNAGMKFVCKPVYLKPVNSDSFWTSGNEQILKAHVAHGEGRYVADGETLEMLEGEGRVAFVYCTQTGEVTPAANPNGSLGNIAGILNRSGNVLGLMPHPERVVSKLLGGEDGRRILARLAG